jgi:hypothetical protein
MTVDTKKLRTLAEHATPGPWSTSPGPRSVAIAATYGRQKIYATPSGGTYPNADQLFIAAANPQTVLSLLDELKTLRTQFSKALDLAAVPERKQDEQWDSEYQALVDVWRTHQ